MQASDSDKPEHASVARADGRAPRILLVEDNDINALLARRMLEKAGCEARLTAATAVRPWMRSGGCSMAPILPTISS